MIKDQSQRPSANQLLSHPFLHHVIKPIEWVQFIEQQVLQTKATPPDHLMVSNGMREMERLGSVDSNHSAHSSAWNFTQKSFHSASQSMNSGRLSRNNLMIGNQGGGSSSSSNLLTLSGSGAAPGPLGE